MNVFLSSTTKYRGLYYSYTCQPNETNREILVTVSKHVLGFLQHTETFSVPKKRILKLKCKNITEKTTLIQDLFYLAKYKYYPTIENCRVTFKKSSFLSAFKCNLFRHLLDMNRLLVKKNETCQMLTLQNAALARDARLDKSMLSHPSISIKPSPTKNDSAKSFLSFSDKESDSPLSPPPIQVEPPKVKSLPSISSIKNSVEAKVQLIEFPTEALRTLLKFCKDIHLKDLIKEVDANMTSKSHSSVGAYLLSLAYDLKDLPMGDLLKSNFTGHMAFNMTSLILNVGYDNCLRFKNFYDDNSNLEDLKNSGKLGQAYLSGIELGNYLNKFYLMPEMVQIDTTKLILSLLNDRELFHFLNEDGVMDQMVSLIISLGIPHLEASMTERALEKFIDFQKIVIDHSSDASFSTMGEILEAFTLDENKFEGRIESFWVLIKDLLPFIKTFVAPQTSIIKDLLHTNPYKITKSVNANLSFDYYDCKKCFENFKDKSLGNLAPLFIATPLQTQINNRRLDQKIFSDDDNSLGHHFKGMAFEGFSFKKAKFENFSFSHAYLTQCDFTDTSFTGKITFKKTYLDSETKDSLLTALYSRANSELTIEGLEDVYLITKSIHNDKITKPSKTLPKRQRSLKPSVPPVTQPWGLVNLTNSCYMNATLQLVFNIPSICQALAKQFQSLSLIQDQNIKVLITSLYNLQQKKYTTSSLEQITQLKNLRSAAYKSNALKGNLDSQQDAREFLTFILECLNWAPVQTRDFASSLDGKQSEMLGIGQLIHNHLFSVSIGNETEFQKILNNYFVEYKSENRIINNQYFKDWKKTTKIENDPEYVIIHIDRSKQTLIYIEDNVTIKKVDLSKLHTVISFPNEVSLTCKKGNQYQNIKYEIVSYLNHIGQDLNTGHYDAYVKNFHDSQWYYCDDTETENLDSPPTQCREVSLVILKKL